MQYSPAIKGLLSDMEVDALRVEHETTDHWVRARSLKPDSASLLYILGCSVNAQRILEIGASVGYSTVHLALAAQETGGHVTTIELLPTKYQQAQANLSRGGLSGCVTQLLGDARILLKDQAGSWDLVFVDAEKDVYLDVWDLFKDQIRPGGIVAADNAVSHAEDLIHYQEAIRADGRFATVTVPIGQGMEVSYRQR